MSRYIGHTLSLMLLLFLMTHCGVFTCKRNDRVYRIFTQEAFMHMPFGYKPTIRNFKKYLPDKVRVRKYTRQGYHPVDTIYKFYYRNSKLLVNKSSTGHQIFMAGILRSGCISLKNGIRPGIRKRDFVNRFADLDTLANDTIRYEGNKTTNNYMFIFEDEVLKSIKIDNLKRDKL